MSIPRTGNRPGRPKEGGVSIHLVLRPELLAALESWMAAEPGEAGRAEAIRRLMTRALREAGHFAD
jgi:hypothetical protein